MKLFSLTLQLAFLLATEGRSQRHQPRQSPSVPAESQKTHLTLPKKKGSIPPEEYRNVFHKGTILDKCYEMQKDKSSAAPLRGPEKTLAVLQATAAAEGKGWETLTIPPFLKKSLKEMVALEDGQPPYESTTIEPIICPSEESLFPCICNADTRTINCSATANFTQIREIFANTQFKDTSFRTFLLYDPETPVPGETVLLDGTFGAATFVEVYLENTDLHVVADDAFRGSENTLKMIRMQHNFNLHSFPFTSLQRFPEVTEVRLGFGQLQRVTSLNSMPKLETLLLNSNSIDRLDAFAFAALPVLVTLDLGKNRLQAIDAHDFSFSSTEVALYLDENEISNIEDDAFSREQPTLLDIYSNKMTTLNITVFKPILDNIIEKQYDTYIDAGENPLCCKAIEWILADKKYYDIINLPDIDCYQVIC